MAPVVYAHEQSADVAKNVADYVIKIQNQALEKDGSFNVAVSGGSLVKSLRLGLADRSEVQWAKWNIYFSDERLVPLAHEDSNYGLLKKDLLDHLKGDKPTCWTIDESKLEDAKASAEYYEGIVTKNLGSKPKLHLILLGCGPDGHTCSLFPGHKLLQEKSRFVAEIEDSPKPPPRRITITFPVLSNADNIAFVAEGAGKAPVLKDIFEHPEKGLPSALVNALDVPVAWFVNNAAVEGVKVPSKF